MYSYENEEQVCPDMDNMHSPQYKEDIEEQVCPVASPNTTSYPPTMTPRCLRLLRKRQSPMEQDSLCPLAPPIIPSLDPSPPEMPPPCLPLQRKRKPLTDAEIPEHIKKGLEQFRAECRNENLQQEVGSSHDAFGLEGSVNDSPHMNDPVTSTDGNDAELPCAGLDGLEGEDNPPMTTPHMTTASPSPEDNPTGPLHVDTTEAHEYNRILDCCWSMQRLIDNTNTSDSICAKDLRVLLNLDGDSDIYMNPRLLTVVGVGCRTPDNTSRCVFHDDLWEVISFHTEGQNSVYDFNIRENECFLAYLRRAAITYGWGVLTKGAHDPRHEFHVLWTTLCPDAIFVGPSDDETDLPCAPKRPVLPTNMQN